MSFPRNVRKKHIIPVRVVTRGLRRMASLPSRFLEDLHKEAVINVPDEFDHLKIGDVRQFSIGIVFLFSIATCSAMINNIAKDSLINFSAPSFLLWTRNVLRCSAFPIYVLFRWTYGLIFQRASCSPKITLRSIFRESSNIYGERKVSPRKLFTDIAILVALTVGSLGSQYFTFAPLLVALSTGNTAAMGASSIVFVYCLSVIVIKIDVMAPKVFGVAIAMVGVGLLLLVEVLFNVNWKQSIVVLAGALFTAVYQVTYRVLVGGTTNLGRICFSISLLSFGTTVLMWPLVLTLNLTDIERWKIHDLPWEIVLKTTACGFALVILINVAVAWTNPFFTSLGFLMTVPLTYMFDVIWNGHRLNAMEVIGSSLVCIGFAMLVFAEVLNWESVEHEGKNISGNARRFRTYVQNFNGKPVLVNNGLGQLTIRAVVVRSSSNPELIMTDWSENEPGRFRHLYT